MLHFNGLEPIDFKGKLYTPKLDAEKRARLQIMKFETEADMQEATEVLCSCFDEEEAKSFIRNNLSPADKQVIAVYLAQGETGLANMSKFTDGAIDKVIEKRMDENA